MIPSLATLYLPLLLAAQAAHWPAAPLPWHLAGLIEQETCIRLDHPKCWNPKAELKTAREYGYGLGQTTIAYRADGSVRFDKQAELRAAHRSLRGWTFERRFDASYQLTAVVEMTHGIWRRVPGAGSDIDRWAFTLSGYNGGEGHVRRDRLLCGNVAGCDPDRWFGHVEAHSVKSREAWQGYGRSPYQINREHVRAVIKVRAPKYAAYWEAT
jgi:hypothetical protein